MSSDEIAKYVTKPATAFAIGAGATYLLTPNAGDVGINLGGMFIPLWALGGFATALGVEVGQLASDYGAPHITNLTAGNAPAHTLINIGLGAAGTALAFQLAIGDGWVNTIGIAQLIAVAAAAEVGSGYATELYWKPFLEQYMH
jgi:hypothetical protein